jgi:hypothetical protein
VHRKLLPLQAADRSTDRSRLIEEERMRDGTVSAAGVDVENRLTPTLAPSCFHTRAPPATSNAGPALTMVESGSFKTKTPSPDLSDEGVNLLNLLNPNQ